MHNSPQGVIVKILIVSKLTILRPNQQQGETQDDCEDPDRCIIFDDVAGHLFWFSKDNLKVAFEASLSNRTLLLHLSHVKMVEFIQD